jgi:hypothetical protein
MRHAWAAKQRCWLGPSRYPCCRRISFTNSNGIANNYTDAIGNGYAHDDRYSHCYTNAYGQCYANNHGYAYN